MILGNRPNRTVLRQVRAKRNPRAARVGCLQQIRFEVSVLMIVETDVRGVRVVIRSDHAADVSHIGDAGKLLDAAPILAAVVADVQHTVIRADVKQALFLLRFGDG